MLPEPKHGGAAAAASSSNIPAPPNTSGGHQQQKPSRSLHLPQWQWVLSVVACMAVEAAMRVAASSSTHAATVQGAPIQKVSMQQSYIIYYNVICYFLNCMYEF